ncbi:MAG TPA: hypothetical protein DEF82_02785 [Crocinitomicaceae bacterium]|nr:hypothetical protein [Crocinitomicaceae bacterium]
MAKPIFIIRIPVSALETMGSDKLTEITKGLQTQLDDYHVLSMIDNHVETASFQCFNADTVPEIELDALKEMCMNTLNDIK